MPKTNKDIMLALFTKMGGPVNAKLMMADFEQRFKTDGKLNEVISDEYYDKTVKAMDTELPHFLEFLMKGNFPELPPDFGTRN